MSEEQQGPPPIGIQNVKEYNSGLDLMAHNATQGKDSFRYFTEHTIFQLCYICWVIRLPGKLQLIGLEDCTSKAEGKWLTMMFGLASRLQTDYTRSLLATFAMWSVKMTPVRAYSWHQKARLLSSALSLHGWVSLGRLAFFADPDTPHFGDL